MSQKTKIEWCDSTFNPWIGCTKVGPGCDHCYAETMNTRFKGGNWGPGAPRRRTAESNWQNPLAWNEKAASGLFVECSQCGKREFRKWDNTVPPGGLSFCSNPECESLPESDSFTARPRVFCASMADWLDNEVPIEWLADLLNLIRITPQLDWLLLSKRIGNWQKRIEAAHAHTYAEANFYDSQLWDWIDNWLNGEAPKNIWLGSTVCNQEEANRDIGKLFSIPCETRFLSIEPMLGAIDLTKAGAIWSDMTGAIKPEYQQMRLHIDWIICGGESGYQARPMHPEWAIDLRDQCTQARVPFFFKQWGEWAPAEAIEWAELQDSKRPIQTGYWFGGEFRQYTIRGPADESDWMENPETYLIGKKRAGRLLDGVEWNQFPRPNKSMGAA